MFRDIIAHATAYLTAHYIELAIATLIGVALGSAPKEPHVIAPPAARLCPAPQPQNPLRLINAD